MFENKKFGFTLTELLIALTIIGAVAALSIPSMMENLNKKQMVTQLKSTVSSIQTLAGNQLAIKKSRTLKDTDFADPAKLLQEKNFQIAKFCDSTADCWADKYRQIGDMDQAIAYPPNGGVNVVLKNGIVLNYRVTNSNEILPGNDKLFGTFNVDLNGKDKPNIVGRDLFGFYISEKGKIMDEFQATNEEYVQATSINDCKFGLATYCIAEIMRNNWTITY